MKTNLLAYKPALDKLETKQIDKQIEFDKNNLYALINNTSDLMWSIDRDFCLITSNKPLDDLITQMTGKTVMKGSNMLVAAFSKEQSERYKLFYERAFSGETFVEIEQAVIPVEYWLEISMCPIRQGDQIVGAACHARDISDRKRIERNQQRVESGLKEAQAIAHLGNWELSFETGVAIWSEEACRMYGLLPGDNRHSFADWVSFIHPDDMDYVRLTTKEAQKTFSNSDLTHRIVLKDGTIKHIESKCRFEFDLEGNAIGLYGVVHDVTDIKMAEKQVTNVLLKLEERVDTRTKELVTKNKSILDSINYAKHIQTGLLCRPTQLSEIFPKSFILSMPRDIVSGDFFWCYQKRNKKFIVVADCTGHGVPAALLSIIGNNLLTQIIENEHIENPSEILELLDVRFAEAVKGDIQEVKDGMDMVVCVVDTYFNEIYFAGANNPLYVSRGMSEIERMAGSRHSIGGGKQEVVKKFDTQRFPIKPGQRIYLSSDGYVSQFGGTKGKKFMKAQFTKTLECGQVETIDQQNNILRNTLVEWMGNHEQVDDIMVVGIEL
ncbi:MAG: SpoIIE family protein phosphatase [Bacteroidota bacterium]